MFAVEILKKQMKSILYIALLFFTTVSFAQGSRSISGHVLDFESGNTPLTLAKVSIKETGAQVLTNEKGFFIFENLKEGTYTLISSFIGYDKKVLKIKASANANKTEIILEPSTISLDDFITTMANADTNTASRVK